MSLHIAPVDLATAKKACEAWHYSRSLPVSKSRALGVWEDGRFIGVVVFSTGANHRMGKAFGLPVGEVIELTRVALTKHKVEVTRVLSIAMRLLSKQNPQIAIMVSYADPAQGHEGTIYKAGNWVPLGTTSPSYQWVVNGKALHKRAFTGSNFGRGKMKLPKGAVKVRTPAKYRFGYPMNKKGRAILEKMRRPVEGQGSNPRADGADPIPPLHHKNAD